MSNGQSKSKDQEAGQLTRRQWLLKLGEAAVLLGFTGARGEADSGPPYTLGRTGAAGEAIAASAFGPAPQAASLPPGLYEPSSDHLRHALSSDSQLHPVASGSETDYVRPRAGPFRPQSLSPPEFETIRRIVELMLGEASDRPRPAGTRDDEQISAVVAEWIDLRVSSAAAVREAARRLAPDHRALAVAYYGSSTPVAELENFDPQRISREGLDWLAKESGRRGGASFLELDERQQIEILTAISDDRPDAATENAGTRFFNLLKREIIRGFYTSQIGLKELDYKGNTFYAASPACPGH